MAKRYTDIFSLPFFVETNVWWHHARDVMMACNELTLYRPLRMRSTSLRDHKKLISARCRIAGSAYRLWPKAELELYWKLYRIVEKSPEASF